MNNKNNFNRSKSIGNIKRVVIKVGTSTLTHRTGLLNLEQIDSLVMQISNIHNKGLEVVLVSSGAIGAGMGKLGIDKTNATLPEKQALAAVGQNVLMHMYQKMFSEHGINIGQILLTNEDFKSLERTTHCKDALKALFNYKVIPIVNENDAIAVEEIKVGDNDTLSALVSNLVEADLLIILSDIDGLYDDNPNLNPKAVLIDHIVEIDDYIESLAKDTNSTLGTGGMSTKIQAVKIAKRTNTRTIIANGRTSNIINKIMIGENIGSYFEL